MDRLTMRINDRVYYTKGKYEDTIPAEMETQDIRECLKRLAEYEDIGTIEEIKALKEKIPFATIKFTKGDLQKIVDEKMKEYEVNIEYNIKEIRNKAIDDFMDEIIMFCQNESKAMIYGIPLKHIEEIAGRIKTRAGIEK